MVVESKTLTSRDCNFLVIAWTGYLVSAILFYVAVVMA